MENTALKVNPRFLTRLEFLMSGQKTSFTVDDLTEAQIQFFMVSINLRPAVPMQTLIGQEFARLQSRAQDQFRTVFPRWYTVAVFERSVTAMMRHADGLIVYTELNPPPSKT